VPHLRLPDAAFLKISGAKLELIFMGKNEKSHKKLSLDKQPNLSD
jgi:hypothetical protein